MIFRVEWQMHYQRQCMVGMYVACILYVREKYIARGKQSTLEITKEVHKHALST